MWHYNEVGMFGEHLTKYTMITSASMSIQRPYKQKAAISIDTYYGFRVVLRGFEPRLREPKTLVLPLHHRTIA